MARIQLIGKPGCHLCDEQRVVVTAVASETGADWEELSILDDPVLADEYWLEIPVVVVDGKRLGYWRVSADSIRAALAQGPTVTPL